MRGREAPLLVGSGLRKTYGDRTVVHVDRIELLPGELLAIFGPNGAGKSTLLRLLAMLEEPTAGRVEFRGATGRAGERALRAASAVVFQRPHFWRESVAYNIGIGLKLRGISRARAQGRVRRVARQLGIDHLLEGFMDEISGGEAQRVSLARALVLDPEVLFLDEPTASLDTDARIDLRQDLERVAREHATSVFLITHDRNEAFHLADRVGVLRDGRLVQVGTPTDIYENPADVYTARVTGAEFTLHGTVTASEGRRIEVDLGGATVHALGEAEAGDAVKIAYRPEDLVLGAPDPPPGGLSTRNLLYATVTDRRDMGGLVRLRLEGPGELVALVTREAAEELGVGPGSRVSIRAKATALHAFLTGRQPGRTPPGQGDGRPPGETAVPAGSEPREAPAPPEASESPAFPPPAGT